MTDRRELIAQLSQIRKSGIAYDREESTLGGICMAAAIQMKDGRVMAAVESVSTPIARNELGPREGNGSWRPADRRCHCKDREQ